MSDDFSNEAYKKMLEREKAFQEKLKGYIERLNQLGGGMALGYLHGRRRIILEGYRVVTQREIAECDMTCDAMWKKLGIPLEKP